MKKLLVILIFVFISNVAFGQLSAKDKTKLRVKLIKVENAYKSADYSSALALIEEIEDIIGKGTFEDVQNWKVKSLVGGKKFEEAKIQLDVLYGLEPSEAIIKDIASYESKIDTGIKAEKARIEKERLTEIERKRKAKIAAEKRKEEEERKQQILKDFSYKQCPDCYGKGYEYDEETVGCGKGGYLYYYKKGYALQFKTSWLRCKTGYLYGDGRWGKCPACNGKGKTKKKKVRCYDCDGKKKILKYIGSERLSSFEESKYIRDNKYTIERHIREKENKKRQAEYKRKQEIERKKKEREDSFKDRILTQTTYFDKDWKEVPSYSSRKKFYRPPVKKVNGLYLVKDYYFDTKTIQNKGYVKSFKGYKSNIVGYSEYYHKSGNVSSVIQFNDSSVRRLFMTCSDSQDRKCKLAFFNYLGNDNLYIHNYHGDILKIENHENGNISYLKRAYTSPKKNKYHRYEEFFINKNGILTKRNICNRKWKVKETINY